MNPTALSEQAESEQQRQQQLKLRLFLCYSTPCLSAGADLVKSTLEEVIKERDVAAELELVATGCMGPCSRGPLLRVVLNGEEQT